MSGDVEAEASRPRPLSGGLWTLFSWLRREERCSSSESLSSAGSDRTAASFAFLTPAHYPTTAPLVLPPSGPPTDSYKKRVNDRNLQRQHDWDITLHRKYGLYRSEGGTGFDAFSLPPHTRRATESVSKGDRDRRATSECLQPRVVHVPGKRRAPLPPLLESSPGSSSTLPRRHNRKRPAPQPPVNFLVKTKEPIDHLQVNNSHNIITQMNPQSVHDKPLLESNDISMGCKSEKYCKKDANIKTDVKTRSEKSFLKQIFENRKRNSAIETSAVKLLPSISELDKQAAEIIENCKLKQVERNNGLNDEQGNKVSHGSRGPNTSKGEPWICTRCLKKYDASVVTCLYCLHLEKSCQNISIKENHCKNVNFSNNSTQTKSCVPSIASTSKNTEVEDKEKLKEMLKEIKDSLPKRPKRDLNVIVTTKNKNSDTREQQTKAIEMPTLRIGHTDAEQANSSSVEQPSSGRLLKNLTSSSLTGTNLNTKNNLIVTQHVMLANKTHLHDNVQFDKNRLHLGVSKIDSKAESSEKSIHTPMKISSLLNPVYIPKTTISEIQSLKNVQQILSKSTKLLKDTIAPDKTFEDFATSSQFKPVLASTSQNSPMSHKILEEENLNLGKHLQLSKNHTKIEQSAVHDPIAKSAEETVIAPKPAPKTQDTKHSLGQSKLAVDKVTHVESPANANGQLNVPSTSSSSASTSSSKHITTNPIIERLDQHSRRRELINQLEQSIAKGDERAAADAAVKLAQLRLSCSVLSFSSQIVSEPSTSTPSGQQINNVACSISDNNENKRNEKTSQMGFVTNKVTQSEATVSSNENTNNLKPVLKISENNSSLTVLAAESINDKPPCSVSKVGNQNSLLCEASTSKEAVTENKNNMVSIAVWVEDREAARGPVNLLIDRNAVISQLRRQAEISLGLAARMQRWIVGRALCTDDNTPLSSLAGPDLSAPFYLCLVETEATLDAASHLKNDAEANKKLDDKEGSVYTELVKLEKQALVPNAEAFECGVCMEECMPGGGVVLRECVHSFCRGCLADVVHHCEEPAVSCPAMGCRGNLQEREIRALLSAEEYERWLARGLTAAESGTRNAFHCRTPDCTGWALCEPGVQRFPCPVCKHTNCVPCQAIHKGENCEQHRDRMKQAVAKPDANQTDEGTRALLNTLITRGEALECPECNAIITKKWGCDWVKCSACKTEICWVTRGRRWGPAGRGDTSGGCRCGVDGKRCHPSCGYCH